MDEERKFSMRDLERCSYRYLQQLAKSMCLPSNVKKVYLIQLIYAKQNCSQVEVDSIVQRVKLERQRLALYNKKTTKKMRLQGTEISSTNNSCSPPISYTARRPGVIIQCSPDLESLSYPTHLVPRTARNLGSDRVLRSFNTKNYKRPDYSLMNDTIIGVIKGERENQTQISIISSESKYPKMNLTARCLLKKQRPSILNSTTGGMCLGDNQMVPVAHMIPGSPVPEKRERSLSGIYPIIPTPTKRFDCIQSVGFRRDDGKISKINALVQKSTQALRYYENPRRNIRSLITTNVEQSYQETLKNYKGTQKNYHSTSKNYQEQQKSYQEQHRNYQAQQRNYQEQQRNHQDKPINYQKQKNYCVTQKNKEQDTDENRESQVEVTIHSIQDIIDSNIDAHTLTNPLPDYVITDSNANYPNMSSLTDVLPNTTTQFHDGSFSVYYHKKIRAEQVRSQKTVKEIPKAADMQLPKINDVFSNFNSISHEVTQPLFVQVSSEADRILNYPIYVPHTGMLENLYNFRSSLLTHTPLLQVATTSNTRCVFSTPVITTAMQQPATVVANDQCFVSSFELANSYPSTNDEVSRMSDFLKLGEQEITLRNYHEALSASDTSTTSQELGASVTIPEMVEDALELISQDGDYMERISMDVRMQCILCFWAGPKFMLEYHIRTEHSDLITNRETEEWNVTCKLGSLVRRHQWLSHVSQLHSSLYILSLMYSHPDRLMAKLSTLSHDSDTRVGSMTIYNKVTGEPHMWRDHILPLPINMPYKCDSNYLQVELSDLNLLPNSANVRLLNGELVNNSPNKVVIGQPELNDIQIIVFVKIY